MPWSMAAAATSRPTWSGTGTARSAGITASSAELGGAPAHAPLGAVHAREAGGLVAADPLALVDVHEVHAGRGHLHHDLTGLRLRVRLLDELDDLGPTQIFDDHRAHADHTPH